jgi:hypothetical protein
MITITITIVVPDSSRDGYLYKEVNVDTFLSADNVKPKIEELQLFQVSCPVNQLADCELPIR